jgi:Na+/phosphate symporter
VEQKRASAATSIRQIGLGLTAILLFVLALEMMKSGANALTPLLRGHLDITHAADSLGLGWLMAYLVLSGSPVAAIAMTFLSIDALTPMQAFTMVTGSRLGASFIVLTLGFIYAVRGHERWTVLSTGVLSLLLTASLQLPALAVGALILRQGWLDAVYWPWLSRLSVGINAVLDPVMNPITALLPQWVLFVLGGALITLSFQLFDKALPELHLEKAGLDRTSRLIYRPAVMFLLGLVVTLLTLSVSVSIGILVPLSARGYVRRENIMPYVLGANISTMIDTLAAAMLLGTPQAVTVVATHMISAVVVSLPIVLLAYEPYKRLMSATLDWTMENRQNFALFLGGFFLVPIALILS